MLIERIETLCRLNGVSGHEDAIRAQLLQWVEPYADEICVDNMGNLLVFKRGLSSDKTCLFAAHMDEVGFMITRIGDNGRLHFDTVGGIDERLLLGKRVWVGDKILGVIGLCPVHLSEGDKTIPNVSQLTIDIGAHNADEAAQQIQLGDVVVFDGEPVRYGDGWLKARALDDRVGCAVLSMLADKTPAVDTWMAFTVQEEVGTRGAQTAAYRLKPNYAFVLENTTAADLAEVPPHKVICRPGNGVVIPFMDGGSIYTPSVLKHLNALADAHGIARQTKEWIAGGTDAAAIQRSRGGVPTGGMAVAARSIHSAISAAKINDMEAMQHLAELAWTTPYTE